MSNPAIWLIVGVCVVGVAVGMYRLGLRKGQRAARPFQYAPFALDRMDQIAAQLAQRRSPIDPEQTLALLPHHGCPNADQWLALFQQQPAEAHQIIHALYIQLYQKGGLHAPTAALVSIQAYHATHFYLRDTGQAPELPRPLWEAYPTEAEWRQLIGTDVDQALRLLLLLELQHARFGGLYAPTLLQDSLAIGHRLMSSARE